MLDQRYEYKRLLGKGANASVYLCFDHKLKKYWAVKEFSGKTDREKMKELDCLKSISCSCFPRIVDAVLEEDKCCIVMDYIEGENLKKILERRVLKEKEVLSIAIQLSEGLRYLHNCIPTMIYMDCKPENIMLCEDGSIKLIDFGSIFIVHENSNLYEKQKISGSKFYAPFEQREGRKDEIDVTTDIYAFGKTLFVLLLGKELIVPQTERLSARRYKRRISKGMDYIIGKCTERDSKRRFQSMEELQSALMKIDRIQKRKKIKQLGLGVMKILGQTVLTFFSLFLLYQSKYLHSWKAGIFSFVIFFILMTGFPVSKMKLWEKKKEIYCGAVKNSFIPILIIFILSFPIMISGCGLKEEKKLNVILYDQQFRKILIQKGASWRIEEDILFSVPKEEILKRKGYIEVTYVAENREEKKFRFQVERE